MDCVKKAQVSPSFTIIQFGLRENGEDFGGVRHVGECSSCIGPVVVGSCRITRGVISELGRLRLLRQIRAFLIPVLQWAVEYKCNTKGLLARDDQLFLGRLVVVAFKVF